jgi:hypothetical protein
VLILKKLLNGFNGLGHGFGFQNLKKGKRNFEPRIMDSKLQEPYLGWLYSFSSYV